MKLLPRLLLLFPALTSSDRCGRIVSRSFGWMLSAVFVAAAGIVFAQTPAPAGPPVAGQGAGAGGGRGGRGGGLPGATPEQTAAVAAMNAALADPMAAVTAARTDLATATFAAPRNAAAIAGAVEKVRAAELELALKRSDEFTKLQSGPNKLSADQVTALIAGLGNAGRGGGPPAPAALGRGRGN